MRAPPQDEVPPRVLFTPGPLTTSHTVKSVMLRDLGSREPEFIRLTAALREKLLTLAGVSRESGYETVLLQGSGTFAIEAAISSGVPPNGQLLGIVNGGYGHRMLDIASAHHIAAHRLDCPQNAIPTLDDIDRMLVAEPGITTVSVVHCETSTGMLNPIHDISSVVKRHGKTLLIDAMSAFGGIPLDVGICGADYVVASPNKCLQGVPGFAFVICRRDTLEASEGWARTLSLDLLAQWREFETSGQFRFTPPTHAVLACLQALEELEAEGGIDSRATRYRRNHRCLVTGMRALGFETYLPSDRQSYIITAFRYPSDPNFTFDEFYRRLYEKGCVIYPAKITAADCFRLGTIGHLAERDVRTLLAAISRTLEEMGIHHAAPE